MSAEPKIVLLAGESGAGKTILCGRIIAELETQGLQVAGLLTPPRFADGSKIGMDAQDIRTGARRALAERGARAADVSTENWHFHADGLAWGAQILRTATPCDVLIVDELGPLELLRNEGWISAIDLLRARQYRRALVTVRPALLPHLQARLEGIALLPMTVTRSNQDDLFARIVSILRGAQ